MGKLDYLFAKNFNVSKLKILVHLGISRIAVLRIQRQARYQLARTDIVQMLKLGHHDRALLRVEQVIKEQKMLDVFAMIEGYCNLLAERINLLKQEKGCPEELKEAVSSIIYASTRCGEFPELIEMRAVLTSGFGKEFAARAIELRNNCGVNPKMIQNFSTRQPTLEIRLKALKEIAAENNIDLKLEEDYSIAGEDKMKIEQNYHQFKPEALENLGGSTVGDGLHNVNDELENMYEVSDSMKVRRKYKDVADAAQAAFESAAYAAEAARMAVELSRTENHDTDYQSNFDSGRSRLRNEIKSTKPEEKPAKTSSSSTVKDQTVERGLARCEFIEKYDSESDDEQIQCDNASGKESAVLESNLDEAVLVEKEIKFDKSDNEDEIVEGEVLFSKTNNLGLDSKSRFETRNVDTEIDISEKRFPLRSETGKVTLNLKNEAKVQKPKLMEEKRPVSVRTRFRAWKAKN